MLKNGVQYDAHAYTTTAECPEPNLKINFKGQQTYVKLEVKGSGDVPCYVKKRDGEITHNVDKKGIYFNDYTYKETTHSKNGGGRRSL